MLDSTAWNDVSTSDPVRDGEPYVTSYSFDNPRLLLYFAVYGFPTITPGIGGMRAAYKGGPLGDADRDAAVVSFTHLYSGFTDTTGRIVFPPYGTTPFGALPPYDVDKNVFRCLYFPGISETVWIDPPEVEGTSEYTVDVLLPCWYFRKDLAEIIHALTSWHVDDAKTSPVTDARDLLSYEEFLAFSERMTDPRFRQVHTAWNNRSETVGSFVDRLLRSSDALAGWGGVDASGNPVLGFSLHSRRSASVLPYALAITASDPGRTAFVIGEPSLSMPDLRLVNNYRRIIGSLIEEEYTFSSVTGGGGESLLQYSSRTVRMVRTALEADANVLTFTDDTSRAAFGDMNHEETFDSVANASSAIGDFRIGTISNPGRRLTWAMGALGLDFFCGERVSWDWPGKSIDTDTEWLIREQVIDFNVFTVSVDSEEVFDVTPSIAPTDCDDLKYLFQAGAGLSTTLVSGEPEITQWDDQSGNGNHAYPIGGGIQPPRVVGDSINGETSIRFNGITYGGLGVSGLGADVDAPQSFLFVALVKMKADNSSPRPLVSIKGSTHDDYYVCNPTYSGIPGIAPLSDTADSLTVSVGPSAMKFQEENSKADRYTSYGYSGGLPVVTPTLTLEADTVYDGPPVGSWRIIVAQAYWGAHERQTTGRTYFFGQPQRESFLAVYDPTTGDLETVQNHMRYGRDGRAHSLRGSMLGVWHTGTPETGAYDSYDLAEIACYSRPENSLPWSPETIEGLINDLRTRWGFA